MAFSFEWNRPIQLLSTWIGRFHSKEPQSYSSVFVRLNSFVYNKSNKIEYFFFLHQLNCPQLKKENCVKLLKKIVPFISISSLYVVELQLRNLSLSLNTEMQANRPIKYQQLLAQMCHLTSQARMNLFNKVIWLYTDLHLW